MNCVSRDHDYPQQYKNEYIYTCITKHRNNEHYGRKASSSRYFPLAHTNQPISPAPKDHGHWRQRRAESGQVTRTVPQRSSRIGSTPGRRPDEDMCAREPVPFSLKQKSLLQRTRSGTDGLASDELGLLRRGGDGVSGSDPSAAPRKCLQSHFNPSSKVTNVAHVEKPFQCSVFRHIA